MIHVKIPTTELLTLMLNDELARINKDETQMMAIIGADLHILVGDFKGIESSEDLEEIIKRNL